VFKRSRCALITLGGRCGERIRADPPLGLEITTYRGDYRKARFYNGPHTRRTADQRAGQNALANTLELRHAAGIATAGPGPDPTRRARQRWCRPARRLAQVAVTDQPRQYAAAPGRWVAHGALPSWLADQIACARGRSELVVAFPRWGPNYRFDPDLRNDLGLLAIWRPDADVELELVGLRLECCHTRLATGPDTDWIATRLERVCGELDPRLCGSASNGSRSSP
jgi:hypothetical protein